MKHLEDMRKASSVKCFLARLFGEKIRDSTIDAQVKLKLRVYRWRGNDYYEADLDMDYYDRQAKEVWDAVSKRDIRP